MLKTINFQGAGVKQGELFHKECILALTLAGFEVAYSKNKKGDDTTKVHLEDVGIEVDAITNNRQGVSMAWEFKGSLQGKRPGLKRTDTMKKAIANGLLFTLSETGKVMPYLVMTSHIPTDNDSLAMMQAVIGREILDVVDSRDGRKLARLCNASDDDIQQMRR